MPIEKLTGQEMSAFCDALLSAFPERNRLTVLVRTRLDAKLEEITGANTSLTEAIFDLVAWGESQGRLRDLLESARAENQANDSLRRLERLLLSPTGASSVLPSPLEISPPPGLRVGPEKFRSVSLDRLMHWQRRLRVCAQAVCRIEKENTITTGFLVGPDIVMTCFWAIEDLLPDENRGLDKNMAAPSPVTQSIVLRFGQVTSGLFPTNITNAPSLPTGGVQEGQTYVLADSWLIDSDSGLNYALLRVNGMPGMDRGVGGEARRWLRPTAGYIFQKDAPLLILSYPPEENVVLTFGTQERLRSNGWQVDYTAHTPFGSAGGPCFSEDLRLVAMHFGKRPEQEKAGRVLNTEKGTKKAEASLQKYGVSLPSLLRREAFLAALLEEFPIF